jgi:hypothetical protein
MLFEDEESFSEIVGRGNHVEILPFSVRREVPGQFVTHVDDPVFYGLIDLLRSKHRQFQKRFFKELVYRDMTQHTNDLHQSKIFKKEVKNVHETDGNALVLVFDRHKMSFAGFPSDKNVHGNSYVNTVVFPIGACVQVHFERRECVDTAQYFNKVFIGYDRGMRDEDVRRSMKDINFIFERLVSGADSLGVAVSGHRLSENRV